MNLDCCHRCGFPLARSQHGQKANGTLRIVCRNHRCLEPPRLATAPVAGEAEMVEAQGRLLWRRLVLEQANGTTTNVGGSALSGYVLAESIDVRPRRSEVGADPEGPLL